MPIDDLPSQIVVLTRDQHRDRYLRSVHVRNPSADVGPGAQPYLDASANADSSVPLYYDAQLIGDATNIRSARGKWLEERAKAEGLDPPRLPAIGASGFAIVSAATGGGTIYEGDELKEPQSDLRYKCLRTDLYLNGDLVPVAGIDTGTETDLEPGTVLQWSSPRPGIGPKATVFEQSDETGLTGGHPEESDEELQGRIEEARRNPPATGNDAEYQRVIEATPAIAVQAPFTYPCIKGAATMGWTFLLRPSKPGGSRIPNGAQIAQVLANLVATEAADDQIFGASIQGSDVAVVFQVTWSRKAPTWVDVSPWPRYVAGLAKVSGATTRTATSFRLTGVTSQTAPVVGQTIGFFDRDALTFRRKRIASVSVVVAGTSWDITCDSTNQVSDTTYVPTVGQIASPWSDSLETLISPVVAHFDGFGPGEQAATFPDPGMRQRRQPEAPEEWPHTLTNRITDELFEVPAVNDIVLKQPTTPYAAPTGVPGVLSYLLELGDLAAFKQ